MFTYSTFEELYTNDCISIPNQNGIYIVKVPAGFDIVITADSTAITCFRGKTTLYPTERLIDKYNNVLDKSIIYVGKADREGGLRKRIWEFVKYGYNEVNNHRGGRAIWQISENKKLLIGYTICEDAERVEKSLLQSYKEYNKTFPLANWRL